MPNIITEIPKKILVIQQRQLGDVLLATHAIMVLKEKFNNAQIDFLTEKKCAEVIDNNPFIENIYYIDKKEQSSFFKQIKFYKKIARNNYDTVISLQNLPRCLLQVFFTKAKYKLGLENEYIENIFAKKKKSSNSLNRRNALYKIFFYTHLQKVHSSFAGAKKLDILNAFGFNSYEEAKPYWYFKDEELQKAKELLKNMNVNEEDLLITMDVTTNKHSRRYPKEYYAQIIHAILQAKPNAKFLFLRAPSEDKEVREYTDLIEDKSAILLPENFPSIRLSAALMARAKYHIGNCSFPRHLAVALDVPSTILIGAGEYIWDYPDTRFYKFKALVKEIPKNYEYLERNNFIWLSPEKEIENIIKHIDKHIK